MDIAGCAVLVTGAASGLGAATARRFAADGALVYGLDLARANAAAEVMDGVRLLDGDVVSETEVTAALREIASSNAPLRAVVNCAGVGWAQRIVSRRGPHDLGLFRKVLEVNVVGTFNVMRLSADLMQTQAASGPDGHRGVMIMTSSVAAFDGQIGQIAYASSKGAVHSMTLCAARDLAQIGVRVCTIAPGTVDTPMLAAMTAEFKTALGRAVPFPQRVGTVDEFARLASFMVDHDYLNGETIRMDGAIRMPPR